MEKKSSGNGLAIAAGIAGLTAAAIAGGYFFYGKDGKKHRKNIKAWSIKAKGEVLEKLEKAKDLSEDVFHDAVNTTTAKYKSVKNVTSDELEAFAKDLKKHWKDIKKEVNPAVGKKITSKAKKAVKKVAKAVKSKKK